MFRAAIQFTFDAILDRTDRERLRLGSALATDHLAIDFKTVAPLARQHFSNAEMHASMSHK
ncbi:hypothetical protein E3H11_25340 [Bradyrhizobium brasilense]|jgi:hypothetical protein|nr:hypothetical protein [Bradyrhizobium brasilense]QOZ15516.1 hypothetical protein XI02_11300 [Bradyrhizobium sp. CCBAU 21365]